jgi:hypothetical protein
VLGVALLGSLLLGPPPGASDPAPRPTVVLMIPERPGDHDERILATVAAHLHELDITLITERYAADLDLRNLVADSRAPIERSDARGILWVDAPERPSGDLALYVLERDSPQIYGRAIAGDLGEAVAIETLANVAAMAATALGEGRAIRLDEPAPEPTPEPEPIATPEPTPIVGTITREGHVDPIQRPWLRLRAGYRGNSYAAALPWQSSVSFAIGVRPAERAHVEMIGDVAIPGVVSTPELDLELRRYAIGLAGGYAWLLPRGWELELAGRIALEPTHRTAIARSSQLAALPADLQWFASAELGLAAGVRLAETVRLSFGAGLAAVLARRELVIDLQAGPQTVVSPHPVRLTTWAGFDFDLVWH